MAADKKGMLSEISKICDDLDVHIQGLNAQANKDDTIKIDLSLTVSDKQQLEKICRSMKSIPGIYEAYRSRS